MHQRLVLTDAHLSATDADTVLAGGARGSCKDHVSHHRHYGRKTSASFVLLGHVWQDMDAGDR